MLYLLIDSDPSEINGYRPGCGQRAGGDTVAFDALLPRSGEIPGVVLSVACRFGLAGCCPLRVGHGHGWNQNLGKLCANASSRIKPRFLG